MTQHQAHVHSRVGQQSMWVCAQRRGSQRAQKKRAPYPSIASPIPCTHAGSRLQHPLRCTDKGGAITPSTATEVSKASVARASSGVSCEGTVVTMPCSARRLARVQSVTCMVLGWGSREGRSHARAWGRAGWAECSPPLVRGMRHSACFPSQRMFDADGAGANALGLATFSGTCSEKS